MLQQNNISKKSIIPFDCWKNNLIGVTLTTSKVLKGEKLERKLVEYFDKANEMKSNTKYHLHKLNKCFNLRNFYNALFTEICLHFCAQWAKLLQQ